jgi:transposase
VDGSVIRSHQHAAGALGSDANSEALGYSKGGFSTKIHLRCEGHGKPVTFVLTPGERNEAVVFEQLMEQGAVKRPASGRPRLRPRRVAGDKAYTGQPIRSYLRRRGIGAVIPRRTNESRRGTRFDKQAYRQRNRVERAFNRLKQFRRVATRYEKRVDNYLAVLTIAAILLWL